MFWFFFFFPGRVNGTCPRGAASLVRVFFDFVYPNLVLSECSSASYFYKHCNSL